MKLVLTKEELGILVESLQTFLSLHESMGTPAEKMEKEDDLLERLRANQRGLAILSWHNMSVEDRRKILFKLYPSNSYEANTVCARISFSGLPEKIQEDVQRVLC